jgi:hypothetical protein
MKRILVLGAGLVSRPLVRHLGAQADIALTVADLVTFTSKPPVDLGPLRGPHGMTTAGGKMRRSDRRSSGVS